MEFPRDSKTWLQQLSLYKSHPSIEQQQSQGRSDKCDALLANQETNIPKRAAVLVCLFDGDGGDVRVILTKRCSKISYPGEVSLPGGKVDEGDYDYSETATREAKEEIGLDPTLVKIVTALDPYMTKRGVSVTPIVGILSDKGAFKPSVNPDEVEAVFDAPLEMFLKNEKQRSEQREWKDDKYLIHFFDYETENQKCVIWGLTAWILIQVASIVYQRSPDFVEKRPNYKLHCLPA